MIARFLVLNYSSIKSLLSYNLFSSYRFQCVFILSLLCSSTFLNAKETPAIYQQCVVCHGINAEGNSALKVPALAGQSADYISRQLIKFSTGLRGSHEKDELGKQMVSISKTLNINKDVPALSTYLSKLPIAEVNNETKGNLMNGSRYYQGKCGACHGGQAQGNKTFKAPKLSNLDIEYLRLQMSNFVKGIRGYDPKDKLGRQMAMMAKMTSGKELDDILHYITQQQ